MGKIIDENTKQNVIKMYNEGSLLSDIAKQNCICIQTIDNIVNAVGIKRQRRQETRKYDVVSLYKGGKTVREVAKEIGGNHRRIAQIVKDAGASRPRKTRGFVLAARAKTCPSFTGDFVSYLDGLLISDGCLVRPSKNTRTSCYTHDSVVLEWLEKIHKEFSLQGIESFVKPVRNRGKQHNLRSYRYDKLYDQYIRWYPDFGEKRIPRDIDFSDKSLLKNWIYGDGTRVSTTLRLCTDSFVLEDTEFLIDSLGKLGFRFKKVFMGLSKSGKDKFRISICKSDGLLEFFEYVGSPEISGLSYKWN